MTGWGKYVVGALIVAIVAHIVAIHAAPRLRMNIAIERLSADGFNRWTFAERVTPASRQIVRPSPDFAYSACAYDLSEGPVILAAAPWDSYWSLSLYAANSDNFFVVDDREAHYGAEITLVQRGRPHPEGASQVVESPSQRGVALIRRLAPSPETYSAAANVAREDVCASVAGLAG
ncbi:DUF1254 domain-containing protein [Terricaulis sp.]|uniref:DUF1254 domain-containing protein n=1 Tax=Terricaulis sp. TaxID=2768686 RepID=UPI002AC68B20|nr:DUF1254 domain-containing protein [Terricaulis sp.]MDZ4692172.1 DUF1254 domain-containing protein [Terricaulis sp.]